MQYTYFIADDTGHVKIGTTRNVHARLAGLQTANPRALRCLAICDYHERYMQKKFESYKVRGEWFKLSDEILEWIEVNAVPAPPEGTDPSWGDNKCIPDSKYIPDDELKNHHFHYVITNA